MSCGWKLIKNANLLAFTNGLTKGNSQRKDMMTMCTLIIPTPRGAVHWCLVIGARIVGHDLDLIIHSGIYDMTDVSIYDNPMRVKS